MVEWKKKHKLLFSLGLDLNLKKESTFFVDSFISCLIFLFSFPVFIMRSKKPITENSKERNKYSISSLCGSINNILVPETAGRSIEIICIVFIFYLFFYLFHFFMEFF